MPHPIKKENNKQKEKDQLKCRVDENDMTSENFAINKQYKYVNL